MKELKEYIAIRCPRCKTQRGFGHISSLRYLQYVYKKDVACTCGKSSTLSKLFVRVNEEDFRNLVKDDRHSFVMRKLDPKGNNIPDLVNSKTGKHHFVVWIRNQFFLTQGPFSFGVVEKHRFGKELSGAVFRLTK